MKIVLTIPYTCIRTEIKLDSQIIFENSHDTNRVCKNLFLTRFNNNNQKTEQNGFYQVMICMDNAHDSVNGEKCPGKIVIKKNVKYIKQKRILKRI